MLDTQIPKSAMLGANPGLALSQRLKDVTTKNCIKMTREEAIKILMGYSHTPQERAALETLIPELRESENERIIKTLQEYVKNRNWMLNGPSQGKVLAWLEKQKESLHISETCKENPDSFIDGIVEVRSFQRGLTEGKRQEQEKQKEQKPAEWSDTNELVFQDICKYLKEEGYSGWVVLLNTLRNGEFKQPVAEWSEEDERVRQELIYFFTHDTTEWFPKRRVSVASVVKFLKSLRPSWKPSEEQMKELNKVRTLNPGLDALYQQLKNM